MEELKQTKHDIAAYAGYLTDEKELLECTSGGIATALSKQMIRLGGYVAGVAYSKDFRTAEYVITNKLEDLDRFKGSKYFDFDKHTVYPKVKELLDNGKLVLFFGFPCVVGAMNSFLKKKYDNLITCELVCHGPTLEKVHQEYIDYLERKYNSNIIDFSVRKKLGKWQPSYLYAEFSNGGTYKKEFYSTEYGYVFGSLACERCYSCRFKGDNRTGDLMIGDFWGANENDIFWNAKGVSAILVHTEKGHEFLKKTGGIKLFPTTTERIIEKNPMIIHSQTPTPEKRKLKSLLEEKGLFYAVKHTISFKTRVKKMIKTVVPQSVVSIIKKSINH